MARSLDKTSMLTMKGELMLRARGDATHLQASHLLDFGRREKMKSQSRLQTGIQPRQSRVLPHTHIQPRQSRSFHHISVVKCENGGDILIADDGKRDPLNRLVFQSSGAIYHSDKRHQTYDIGREVWRLALPALLTQAIEPMALLMETAYVGRLGSVELAAVGVSISIFNLVSKVFNVPLLSTTTSFVAEDVALNEASSGVFQGNAGLNKHVVPAVSSSLFLASILALVEASLLFFGVRSILTFMGVPPGSPMRGPATTYLALRALGAPANILALTIQGVFRGFKDTKTPLYAMVISNVFNIALSPILIFKFRLGVIGAGIATVSSQYLLAFILLWNLSKKVQLIAPDLTSLRLNRFLKSGGFLLVRTLSVLFTMTLATSMAARQGTIPMAGHQILMQIWLATSLLSDALALAGQAIMASAYARGDLKQVKDIAYGILQMGLCFGLLLAFVLSIGMDPIAKLFTTDMAVLEVLSKGVLFVAGTQPLNALAFVFDGLHYGVSDFQYAAYSMMVVGVLSSICLVTAPSIVGLPGIWLGLTFLMGARTAAGWLRLNSMKGPWRFVREA